MLPLQVGDAAALVGDETAARLSRAVQVVAGALAELHDLFVAEADRDPLTSDLNLHLLDGQVR
ncbi:hypothetical protein [Nocardioides marmoraquaticus]